MEEIKLYHKLWTFLPVLLIQLALTIVFLIPITQGKNASFWIWNWSLMLFSGLVFLWELYVVFRERVWHKPFTPSRKIKSLLAKRNITSQISIISILLFTQDYMSPLPLSAFTTCLAWKRRRWARLRAWTASTVRWMLPWWMHKIVFKPPILPWNRSNYATC